MADAGAGLSPLPAHDDHSKGAAISAITGAITSLHDLPDGRYQIAWWDTLRGTVTRRETVNSRHGLLPLHLPPLATDVAAQITP